MDISTQNMVETHIKQSDDSLKFQYMSMDSIFAIRFKSTIDMLTNYMFQLLSNILI